MENPRSIENEPEAQPQKAPKLFIPGQKEVSDINLFIPEQYGEPPRDKSKSSKEISAEDEEKRKEERMLRKQERAGNDDRKKREREFQEGGKGVEVRTGEQQQQEEEKEAVREAVQVVKEKEREKEKWWDVLASEDIMERSPIEVVKAFRKATENERGEHRHLAQERNEMVRENLENGPVKMKIIRGREAIEQARQRFIDKEKRRIKDEEQSNAITTLLARVSEKDRTRKEYMENGVFSGKKYISSIREKLGINGDTFCKLINDGYKVENAKIRNWGLWFRGPAIEIPRVDGDKPLIGENKKEFKEKEEAKQKYEEKRREIEAERWANGKIRDGRRRVIGERYNCTKIIIKEAVGEHRSEQEEKAIAKAKAIEAERKAKEEAEKKEVAKKPKIEIFSRFNKEGKTSEQVKEMEKIKKQIEVDTKRRKEAQKKIQDLIKKQKGGKLLTAREAAFLNRLSEEERQRAA